MPVNNLVYALLFLIIGGSTYAQQAELVKDIGPNGNGIYGGPNSHPNFVKAGNKLYVSGEYNGSLVALWATDGTDTGTYRVSHDSISAYLAPQHMTEFNGELYFNGGHPDLGRELFKSDGTTAGTVIVKDIAPGNFGSDPLILCECAGKLYFAASDIGPMGGYGFELWSTDGTEAGTQMVIDLANAGSANPSGAICLDSVLYFSANDGFVGAELWKTTGTDSSTKLVKNINLDGSGTPVLFTHFNGKFLFYASDATHGSEVWISDGTEAGTQMLKDIHPNGSSLGGVVPQGVERIAVVDSLAFFVANDGFHGHELWKTDGTASGTVMVKDIRNQPTQDFSSSPIFLTAFQNKLWFNASDQNTGQELWVSDGTAAGTQLFMDIAPGTSGNPGWMRVVNGMLWFQAYGNSQYGSELWQSDGTLPGTKMAADINPVGGSGPMYFDALSEDTILFFASHYQYGKEIWRFHSTSTAIKDDPLIPTMTLYPNPTSSGWELSLNLPQPQSFAIEILNLQGKVVHRYQQHTAIGGEFYKVFSASELNLGAGLYGVRFVGEKQQASQKLVIVD